MRKILILLMMMGIPHFVSAQCVVNFNTVVDANLLIIKWDCADTAAVFTGQMSSSKDGPFRTAGSSSTIRKFVAIFDESVDFWFRVKYLIDGKYRYSVPLEISVKVPDLSGMPVKKDTASIEHLQ